jgi:trimeric autotransporter adhesin
LFVDASGNVGVGTSSVNALLEVNNSTAGGEVQRIEGNYSGSGSVILTNWRRAGGSVAAAFKYNDDSSPLCMSIGTTTSHEFRIRTADTDAITIDTSQRVGVGTTSPDVELHIHSTSDNAALEITRGAVGSEYGYALYGSAGATDAALRFFTVENGLGTGEKMRLDASGRLGIGTSSPAHYLHVSASVNDAVTNIVNTDTTNGYGLSVVAGGSASNRYIARFADAGNNAKAIILANGNVGIGTSSPLRKLVVSEGGAQGFEFYPGDAGGGNTLNHYNRSTASVVNATTNANQHIWGRDDGEKARIDTSGRS